MVEWLQEHRTALIWLSGISVGTLILCVLLTPLIVARIPADYFSHNKRPPSPWAVEHPTWRWPVRIARNIAGWILLLAGLAMLVLPGPGIIGILVGLMLVEFPGKYRVERWLVSHRPVMNALGWIRRRRGAPPFVTGKTAPHTSPGGPLR
ncbi:MAG: hypothetical protein IT435_05915 [Phycisphaerales bacterium]|nr:hypothetical protein [Phycisphaerales bacterium]